MRRAGIPLMTARDRKVHGLEDYNDSTKTWRFKPEEKPKEETPKRDSERGGLHFISTNCGFLC